MALCLSPDGRRIISSSMHGPFRFWDPDTQKVVNEVAKPQNIPVAGLSLSPDGSLAVIQGWGDLHLLDSRTWSSVREISEPFIGRKRYGLSRPQFTPDGRFLLLQSDKPELLIYDTKNWKQLQSLPGLPRDAISYFPAPGIDRAIYLSKSGVLNLWDSGQRHEVAKLDENVRLHQVAFSPDESLVAVATGHKVSGDYWGAYRIRIWSADAGELEHELRPFEQSTCESVEGILWWPDGKYLLAATKAHTFFTSLGVGVWSLKSGRNRGEFIGCPTNLTGLALLDDGRRLVAGCGDGRIRVWDAASGIKQVYEFERSLAER